MKTTNTLKIYLIILSALFIVPTLTAQNGIIEAVDGVKVGNSTSTDDGTIRYNGSDFEGRKAGVWTSFTAGGSGSSPWITAGSDINYTTGNVGIGIADPSVELHIDGAGEVLRMTGATSDPWWSLRNTPTDPAYGFGWWDSDSLKFGMNGSGSLHLQTALQSRLVINNAGRVGMGTIEADALLEVKGNSSSSVPGLLITETTDNDYTRINLKNSNYPSDRWTFGALFSTTSDNQLGWYYNGNARVVYNETEGGLGIGTSVPSGKLHVNDGDAYITGANPRLFIVNDGDADARIGFGNNGGGGNDAGIWYSSTDDNLNLGTSTTSGDMHINGSGKVGINVDSGLTAQLSIRANAGNTVTPATVELMENNNSGYPVLKYSNFNVAGHFTNDANGQYGNFLGGDADYRIRYSEDGTTFNTILTALYAYDNEAGTAVNAKDERIGIRTEAPDTDLHLVHKNGVSGHGLKIEHEGANNRWWKMYVSDGAGTLSFRNDDSPTANVGTFAIDGVYTGSDKKMKKNIKELTYGVKEVMKLNTRSYNYITKSNSTKSSIGLIAQEVNDVVPEIVIYDKESDQYSINYSATGILAIKAIQEQQSIIEGQQAQINELIKVNQEIIESLNK